MRRARSSIRASGRTICRMASARTTTGRGCFYEGSWVNGEKEGIGRMQYSNGNVYVGSFKNGVKSGKGCVLNSRGKILKEVFENKKTAE